MNNKYTYILASNPKDAIKEFNEVFGDEISKIYNHHLKFQQKMLELLNRKDFEYTEGLKILLYRKD